MSAAEEKIAAEIQKHGPISFARFMEFALYCPNCGYYEKEEDIIGRGGDYYTSVAVGEVFGELLALQFATWLEQSGAQAAQLVEAGAHDGRLARDILRWMRRRRTPLFEQLQYWILEPSERRRERQRRMLSEFGDKVRWAANVDGVAADGIRGVFFCNELLDAMPVRRFGWNARHRKWFERGVDWRAGRFVWTRLEPEASTDAGSPWPLPLLHGLGANALLEILPDGFTIDVSPAAEDWWRQSAARLRSGRLITLDYGLTAEELLAPERNEGTLRAYHRHRLSADVLAHPGEQDLTAHVNFTAIQAAGESAGLQTEVFQTQAHFLTGIAAPALREEVPSGEWTRERSRQFQTLTHPDHLGRAFHVLVQSRSA